MLPIAYVNVMLSLNTCSEFGRAYIATSVG